MGKNMGGAVSVMERFLVAYSLAVVHELFHYATAKIVGVKVSGFSLRPWGSAMVLPPIRQPWKELAVCAAGPFFHICLIPISLKQESFFFMNSAMLFVNILPALPLDGGRMMKAFFLMKFPAAKAYKLSQKITVGTIFLFCIFSLGEMVLKKKIPTSMVIPFFLILSYRNVKNEHTVGMMRRLSKDRGRRKEGNAYLVHVHTKAVRICPELFIDRENLFFLVGRNGICGILNEQTVLQGLGDWGTGITFDKIFMNMVEKKR